MISTFKSSILLLLFFLTIVASVATTLQVRSPVSDWVFPIPDRVDPEPEIDSEIQKLLDRASGLQASNAARASAICQRALQRAREQKAIRAEALSRNCQGRVQTLHGRYDLARSYFQLALDIAVELGDRSLAATFQYNLGKTFASLGEDELAFEFLEASLYGRKTARDRGISLLELATLVDDAGEPDLAISFLRTAIRWIPSALYRSCSSRARTRAILLDRLAAVYVDTGELERARKGFHSAIEITNRLGSRDDQICRNEETRGEPPLERERLRQDLSVYKSNLAMVTILECQASRKSDASARCPELENAIELLEEAIELNASGSEHRQGVFSFELARALQLSGRSDAALEKIRSAVSAAEALRSDTRNALLRTSVLASHDEFYDHLIHLTVERFRVLGEPHLAQEALQVAELFKARGLLDRRQWVRRVRNDPVTRKKSRELRILETERLQRVQKASPDLRRLEEIESQQRNLIFELEEIGKDETREEPPELPWEDLPAFSGSQLPENSQLLYFVLTDEKSFLWRLSSGSFQVFELPPRQDLEKRARLLSTYLSANSYSNPETVEEHVRAFSRYLLNEVAPHLAEHRMYLVLDGALAALPFSRLENPSTGKMLLEEFEIVHLPSLMLSRTFNPASETSRPELDERHELIALGDPNYRPRNWNSQIPGSEKALPFFSRLFASREEVEYVFQLYNPTESTLLLGSDVNRQAILEGALEGYRIVHLAAHAESNNARPELTRIILSQLDQVENPIEYNLFLHEIDDLFLHCDLIVLSACSTAEGRIIRGEGTISLARSVLAAGARQAVVSLWQVPEDSTAALMMRFHEAMVLEGLSPAAALRSAQLSIRAREGWENPSHWAGFILIGD